MNPTSRQRNLKIKKMAQKGQIVRPSWDTFLLLGSQISKQLPNLMTCREVGKRLHIPTRKVQYESLVALGKVVYGLRKSVEENCNDLIAE